MSRPFLILFLTILISCHKNQKIKIRDKWDNGNKKEVLTYDNLKDSLTYLREYFYPNGQIGTKGKYVIGKQDGHWQWWFDNGKLKDDATFINGAYIRERKHWRMDGTLNKVEVINGACFGKCCDGKLIFYDEKGIKLIEYPMKNGIYDGETIVYYPNGKVKRRFTYVNGMKQGMNYEYNHNGQIDLEGMFIDDLEEGKWIFRDSTGKFAGYDEYKNGKIVLTN